MIIWAFLHHQNISLFSWKGYSRKFNSFVGHDRSYLVCFGDIPKAINFVKKIISLDWRKYQYSFHPMQNMSLISSILSLRLAALDRERHYRHPSTCQHLSPFMTGTSALFSVARRAQKEVRSGGYVCLSHYTFVNLCNELL